MFYPPLVAHFCSADSKGENDLVSGRFTTGFRINVSISNLKNFLTKISL